ncbi:hypothetical protein L3X38_009704 [Prunus dulcis]|uniref:LOB domain-containing protein n=1 Tax=Prunus dulcis TaxID=3755 RepID=A0AAD4ZDJ0_PRUDU|nr:hypothetical protein L3X38_009704 [Prunus dulcis]
MVKVNYKENYSHHHTGIAKIQESSTSSSSKRNMTIQQELLTHLRVEAAAAETLCNEAQCRIQDPIYGCVGVISQLHQQIQDTECQLAKTHAEIALANSDGQQPPQAQVDQQI